MIFHQDYLITLLYSKHPQRNEWVDAKVITKTEYNTLGEEEEEKQENYLVEHNTNKYFFVLNEYKTSKEYGRRI